MTTENGASTPSAPRRVGLVAPLPPQIGGIVSVADWLVRHEREIGCRYETFDLWRPPGEEKGGRLRLATIPRQLRLLSRFLRWLPGAPRLVHYSVVCTVTGLTRDLAFILLLRAVGRTTLAHIHGSDVVALPKRSYRALALRLVGRLAAESIAVAPRSAVDLARLEIPARHIYNPIRFVPNGGRRAFGSPPLRLLFVGTYGSRKGCPELIEALADAHARGASVTLTIVGKEEYRGEEETLRRLVRERGLEQIVDFLGVLSGEALPGTYKASDVICLPSKREALPMVLLEAMAFGLPALSTRVGGIPDVVEDGQTGFLVEPGDTAALSAAISELAGAPARVAEMGEAARTRVLELAGTDAVAREWRRLYERHAEGQP